MIERLRLELDNGKLTEYEYHRALDKFLDGGNGEKILARHEIAEIVSENLLRYAGESYMLHAWVVMPNHVHLLLTAVQGSSIAAIMQRLKSYTAHAINKRLDRSGHVWGKEYFDRYIRSSTHFQNAAKYIEMNPVKAHLCREPEHWPFSSASRSLT